LWLLLALAIGCALVFWLRRPIFPWRQLLPFQAVVCFSLVYTGWPALLHGFNWLSYVNGDMTYFAGGAVRMLENPFSLMPTLEELVGKDYTQYTWSEHVVHQVRFGGEMLLAWCSGITGLNPLEEYMPLVLALHASQICAAAGLVLTRIRLRKAAVL